MSKFGFAIGIGAAALMLGACASQNSNSVAANQKQKQVAKQQHMVCISEPGVGSHIPKTTCMTQAQYKELQKEHQEEMDRMKNKPQMQGPSTNGGGPPLRPRI